MKIGRINQENLGCPVHAEGDRGKRRVTELSPGRPWPGQFFNLPIKEIEMENLNSETQERLKKLAYKLTVPFCYSCYEEAPSGLMPTGTLCRHPHNGALQEMLQR